MPITFEDVPLESIDIYRYPAGRPFRSQLHEAVAMRLEQLPHDRALLIRGLEPEEIRSLRSLVNDWGYALRRVGDVALILPFVEDA